MKSTALPCALFLFAVAAFLPHNSLAAPDAYLTVTSTNGKVLGGVNLRGKEGTIEVTAYDHSIVTPREGGSGMATGRRQHKPFTITKPLDQSTPVLYDLLIRNQNLPSVQLDVWTTNVEGADTLVYQIKLTNAAIMSIEQVQHDNIDTDLSRYPIQERVTLTYQKIEWTWVGGKSTRDSWTK